MKAADLLGTSLSNLRRRKLRTGLTVLAVVIGATLISLMVSLSSGVQSFVVEQFSLFIPQDAMYVSNGQSLFGGQQGGSPREITGPTTIRAFTSQDVSRIEAVGGVQEVDPVVNVSVRDISPQGSDKKYTVSVSTGPDYLVRLRPLVAGDYFGTESSGECLIPYSYVTLFGWGDAQNALGRTVSLTVGKLNPYNSATMQFQFNVRGVMQNTLNASQVLVPTADAVSMARYYTDSSQLYSSAEPGTVLLVKAAGDSAVPAVAGAIESLGYTVTTAADILAQINNVFRIIQIGLAAFGIISLVVAAIGIINTLLMAVYERTREIGIMKAVGATRDTVRSMFTLEGAALGFIGGVIGVILGWGASYLVSRLGTLSTLVSADIVILAISVSVGIGLFFGFYPAWQGSKLDPIQALRAE